jgi:AAA15 family ATPase/GTPase
LKFPRLPFYLGNSKSIQNIKGLNMIEHAKITHSELIKTKEFQNFGQINVICGKNNSGKSLFLSMLFGNEIKFGKVITSDDLVEKLIDVLPSNYSGLTSEIQKYVENNTHFESGLYFEDQAESFSGRFPQVFQIGNLYVGKDNFLTAFNHIFFYFRNESKRYFVPAKRKILNHAGFNGTNDPFKNLESLVSHIHYLKNQQPGSIENEMYKDLRNNFFEISDGIEFDVFLNPQNAVSLKFLEKNQWLVAEDCGLGLQDLLIIVFVCLSPNYNVIGIEEPENHMHPEIQRKLFKFLKSTGKQYFITTHSSVFLDSKYADNIYMTKKDDSIEIISVSDKAELLTNLGYSVIDNLVSSLIILVEGPSDIPVIEEFAKILDIYDGCNFKMWPLGGDIMDQLDLSVMSQSFKLLVLIDKDPKSSKIRNSFMKKCKELEIEVFQLERYAIENYFTLDAIKSVFLNQIDRKITKIDNMIKLEDQIGMNIKKNNRKIAREMTREDIEDTDLKRFFDKVREMAQ